MAVRIRLSRIGKKHRPFWRVVAVDSRKKRDGAFLADFGTYDPINGTLVTFRQNELNEWIEKGAQCSLVVKRLIKLNRKGEAKAAA